MIAQYTGITFSLSISGSVFVNEGLKGLHKILPDFSSAQLSSILSGQQKTQFFPLLPRLQFHSFGVSHV